MYDQFLETVCAVPMMDLRLGMVKRRKGENKQTVTTKLLEEILSKENLEKACTAVVRNKGASGIDGMKVNELKGYICEHGESIIQKIQQRKYKPLAVRRVQIPKPDGNQSHTLNRWRS